MEDFSGQVVFVTGAASGIGLGIAKAFHEAGANVIVGDFRPAALENAKSGFEDSSRVLFQQVDVRDQDSVIQFLDRGEDAFGPVTIMVANAGIYPNTLVLDMEQSEWDRVMETNVRGVFLTCQAAARSMVGHGTQGKILTVSSGASASGRRGASHYCASKAGVVMFTKVLALELSEHKINVNCLSPGLIEVRSEVSPLSEEYTTVLTKSIPWGRIGQPADIAKAALFLASPSAEFITGTVLSVDGGSSAGRAFLPTSTPTPKAEEK
jgi:NAD(P)-dependent dehydrogenase (short-subunit alcohol dehydrogenase family)